MLPLVFVLSASAQDENFRLVISGEVAEKLEAGSSVTVATIGTGKSHWASMSTTIEGLPLELPYKHFSGRTVWVNFFSPHPREMLFSVRLSASLFDRPRKINVLLNKPTPKILLGPGMTGLGYRAAITKRMSYNDLPTWDSKAKRLVPSKSPPVLTMADRAGQTVFTTELGDGCMGGKWYTGLFDAPHPDQPELFEFSVLYDSGGIFPPIETKLGFEYVPSR